jgi:hypothetical protein
MRIMIAVVALTLAVVPGLADERKAPVGDTGSPALRRLLGLAPTDENTVIVQLPPDLAQALDYYALSTGPEPTRAEAVEQILTEWLKANNYYGK